MRHLLSYLLLACAGAASAQVETPDPLPLPDLDLDLMQGGPAWLVGDHVKARRHFLAAAQRGHPLGQYNLAMMLLYREGGPCDAALAVALLRKSADAGISPAREALEQMQDQGTARKGPTRPFSCPFARQARSTPAVGPVHPTVAR
jgi:TPR repeat protein